MARAAGNTVTYWRCDVNAWIASSNDTSDVIRIQVIWKHVSGWVASSNIRFSAWADGAGGSGDRTLGYGEISGGEQVLLTWDTRVNRSESARTINCHASITLPYGMPGTSTAHVGVSIPGIKYLPPNPPKNVGFTRENDNRIVVKWSGNWDNAARKPWKQVISNYRKASNGAGLPGWSGVNQRAQNWDATSSAFGCGANSQIQLAVWARNQAGDSSHVDSGVIYTTPKAPRITATQGANNVVTIRVDAAGTYGYDAQIQRATSTAGPWSDVRSVAVRGGAASVTDTPGAGTFYYRARSTRPVYGNDTGKGVLYSGYALSGQVTTIQAPKAPTVRVDPDGTIPTGDTASVTWTRNHPDGTAQSSAQVKIVDPSGTETVKDVTGTTAMLDVACDVSGIWTVSVRTKGLAAEWGAWSTPITMLVATAPDITITSPTDTITGVPIRVAWSIADVTGVAAQTLYVLSEGRVVYGEILPVDVREHVISTARFVPTDGSDLQIGVTARGGSGLEAHQAVSVHVTYTPPDPPEMTVAPDYETYSNLITVDYVMPDDLPDTQTQETQSTIQTQADAAADGQADETAKQYRIVRTYWLGDANKSVSVMDVMDVTPIDPGPPGEIVVDPIEPHAMVERVDDDGSVHLIADHVMPGDAVTDHLPPLNRTSTYRATVIAATGATSTQSVTLDMPANTNAMNFGAYADETLRLGWDSSTGIDVSHSTESFDFADGEPVESMYASGTRAVKFTVSDRRPWDQALFLRMLRLAGEAFAWYRDASGYSARVQVDAGVDYDTTANRIIKWDATMTQIPWVDPQV